MRKYIKLNGADDCDSALYEYLDGKLVLVVSGDYYHDKIDEFIDGFFRGLHHCDVKYDVWTTHVSNYDEEFSDMICEFDLKPVLEAYLEEK